MLYPWHIPLEVLLLVSCINGRCAFFGGLHDMLFVAMNLAF